jgi:uncharacterized membrane protein YcaP (DUF421 family)
MTGGDNSLIGGIIAATTLVAVNTAFSRVGHRVPYLKHLFESQPTLLVQQGKLIKRNLERENVEEDELMMAVREHGIDDLQGVDSAYLERDGSISIIPKDAPGKLGSRRHIRQFHQR